MENKKDLELKDNNLPALSDNSFYRYLQEINKIPSLTAEEEFMLAKAYLENQDLDAAHKLVSSHLKLVAKIALTFKNYSLPVTELVSEGNLGLMHAVKKFDYRLGFRLSTYAMWWIKASIQEYILKSWSLVKIGTTATQKKLFFSLNKIKNRIRNSEYREINHDDFTSIAKELGVNTSDVIDMNQRLSASDISLNSPSYNDDSNDELLDFIPETRNSQEALLANKEDNAIKKKLLAEAIGTLSEREIMVISKRRLSDNPSTLDELSQRLNISKERVRQIENRSFEKIQAYVLSKAIN